MPVESLIDVMDAGEYRDWKVYFEIVEAEARGEQPKQLVSDPAAIRRFFQETGS
jgi:hypothetical protein